MSVRVSRWIAACLLTFLGIGAYAPRAVSLDADVLSDGPQGWTAPPYWSSSPAAAEQSGRAALAEGRQALATPPSPLPFVAVTPCRLVDTRGLPAALPGGGFLPSATVRNYTLTGACGIPADAQAISLNATVTNTTGPGFLVLWPKGGATPPVSTLNFLAGQTVANAAVVPMSADGGISVAFGVSGGDVVLDTNGYYSPLGVVNSINGRTGDADVPGGREHHDHAGSGHDLDRRRRRRRSAGSDGTGRGHGGAGSHRAGRRDGASGLSRGRRVRRARRVPPARRVPRGQAASTRRSSSARTTRGRPTPPSAATTGRPTRSRGRTSSRRNRTAPSP